MQIKIPQRSSLCPSMMPPRKRTDERSGNLRLASPLASLVGRAAAPIAANSVTITPAPNFLNSFRNSQLPWDRASCGQVRIERFLQNKIDDELRAGTESLHLCTQMTGELRHEFAFLQELHLVAAEVLLAVRQRHSPCQCQARSKVVSCPERKRNVPLAGNPFPAHPQFARNKQNSGRGEGLIYSIPGLYFQMTQED